LPVSQYFAIRVSQNFKYLNNLFSVLEQHKGQELNAQMRLGFSNYKQEPVEPGDAPRKGYGY
jgi:hypothetical protein